MARVKLIDTYVEDSVLPTKNGYSVSRTLRSSKDDGVDVCKCQDDATECDTAAGRLERTP
jgi:hypothetical protein